MVKGIFPPSVAVTHTTIPEYRAPPSQEKQGSTFEKVRDSFAFLNVTDVEETFKLNGEEQLADFGTQLPENS